MPGPFYARIARVQDKGNGIKITFQSPSEHFDLKPGQYIEVYRNDDPELKKPLYLAATLTRKKTGFFKVNAGKPQHRVSTKEWLFFQAREEANMPIKGPFGRAYPLEKIKDRPLLLIMAGSGLASVRSIFPRLLEDEQTRILYSAKTFADVLWPKKVKLLAAQEKNYITLTREKTDLEGFNSGRLNEHLLEMPVTEDTQVFICGPTEFMRDIAQILLGKSIGMANIHIILNTIIPGKESMCPLFCLDELSESERLNAIGLHPPTGALSFSL